MLRSIPLLCALVAGTSVAAEFDCGDPFVNGVGPWDYRDQEARSNSHKIPIVEKYHFTPKVEQLVAGQANVDPAGDIDYVLRAVPNHYRALYAISRYERSRGPIGKKWHSAECYFDRAMRFRPDDAVVKMLFGVHFAMRGQHEDAIRAYEAALPSLPDSPELHYDLGLSLFALGEFDKAAEAAKIAYDNGYPLQGLRRKLAQKGYNWDTSHEDPAKTAQSAPD